jgi:hypothetical protein
MKEIIIPCFINGRPGTQKVYIGDGCKDDVSPVRSQEAYFASRGISLKADAVQAIISLRDLARRKGVSFEELTVLAYVVANKKIKGETEAADEGGNDEGYESGDEGDEDKS